MGVQINNNEFEVVKDEELIENVFQNHYDFHKTIGVDFVKSASGHIDQVSSDYQGRVLYELLQNAFDRAENKILVKVIGKSLFVANDGRKFTYNSHHDYKDGSYVGEKFIRYDFQALCSISTSNKTAIESIGNKGVGFKSVYALGRYANVHTKGIINPDTNQTEANISFRLYDIFDNVDDLPKAFDKNIKEHLGKTIESIHGEFLHRGVPGYYFPLRLKEDNNYIFADYGEEMVTVIEVPFNSKEEIKKLIDEVEKIHFEFVGLKYNQFEIKFETEETSFVKRIISNDNTLFSGTLNEEKLQVLAKKAGIEIQEPKVAIKLKNEPTGFFYNYLPTKKDSPFKYIDFHADFHTTVDRKSINFDGNKVGAYNRALLEACIELFFQAINKSLPTNQQVDLDLRYLNSEIEVVGIENFNWHLFEIGDSNEVYEPVRRILSIAKNQYHKASSLLTNLALNFFEDKQERKNHEAFLNNVTGFINYFSRRHNDDRKWPEIFKECLGARIREKSVQFLPGITLTEHTKEILFRENKDLESELPNVAIGLPSGITVTDLVIKDPILKEALEVKDFKNYNELLKYFKQCDFSGAYSREEITEEEQKNTLKSLYSIFLLRSEHTYLSTHRYSKAFTVDLRDKNTTLNQASFNVSTLFLKLQDRRYKPAQLCVKAELDLDFLDFCDIADLDNWLRFMGVSTEKEYRFVDVNIYNQLGNGIDILPQLLSWQKHEHTIKAELLEHIHIVNSNEKLIHPAIINDNNYRFLKNIKGKNLKPNLDNLLVKNYQNFPPEYLDILRKRLIDNLNYKNGIIQFYQNIFEVYARQGWYLVIQNDALNWVRNANFHILKNKFDFELCTKQFSSKPILAYYLGGSDILENKVITPQKGEITYLEKNLDSNLKKDLAEKIPFVLSNLSHSKNSEVNYLSEDQNLTKLQLKFEKMHIFKCSQLKQKLSYGELGYDNSFKAYAYNGNELFLSGTCSNSQAAQGICDYLFNNIGIKEQVELIVFHKELEDLRQEIDKMDLQVINRKWKPDYQEKFNDFQTKILSLYSLKLDGNNSWYKYNNKYRNPFLIGLQKDGKLSQLQTDITLCQREYEGYFDEFRLEIDYSHINSDIIVIQTYYDKVKVEGTLKERLNVLIEKAKTKTLGIEDEIDKLKSEMPEIFSVKGNETELETMKEELLKLQDIEDIYAKVKLGNVKSLEEHKLDTMNQTSSEVQNNCKQIIFRGSADKTEANLELEITGASGEVEVLICLIDEFLQMTLSEKRLGVEAVRIELSNHFKPNNNFDKYAEECLRVITDFEKLSKALIPLFYIAREYKYAPFDLITYRNGKATLIEVKSTNNINSKSFYLSIAEVNKARGIHDYGYEIVRVTPQSIIFMGNPIKEIDESIREIKTNGFTLKPRNYELIIN